MKKYFALCLLIPLVLCVPATAKEWYEGGTLHSANIGQWKQASYENKLATCADILARLWLDGDLNIRVNNMYEFKPYVQELVDFIDSATKGVEGVNRDNVSFFAFLGIKMMGWLKKSSTSSEGNEDLMTTIELSEEADKKLKANGFLINEEIEAIWEEEKTPDVLDKISETQQKAIVNELKKAQDKAEKSSHSFGASIKNPTERSMYQQGVQQNKVLKATRAIAKKYGIRAGDIITIEEHVSE